ncbi:Fe2+-enterobactin ABC transporter substrate-binding protein [Pluralibacter gergoviae]
MRLALCLRSCLFLCAIVVVHTAQAEEAPWPRQFEDSRGTHILNRPPTRIVSTSVTLTGSLVAIDAPVVASGSTASANRIADARGFFRQWGDIAHRRGIVPLGQGEASVEAIAVQKPDLILISASGGDSAMGLYDQLAALAPVLIVSYDDKSWQSLLTRLGSITGHEKQARARIARFDAALAQMKRQIHLPPQPVNAIVWDSLGQSANIWTADSAQGQFLVQAGFTLAPLPPGIHPRATQGKRHDIVPLEGENIVRGLTGKTLLLFAADDNDRASLLASPLLAHQPAVSSGKVYSTGPETFRLDYYSAMGLVARMTTLFGQ